MDEVTPIRSCVLKAHLTRLVGVAGVALAAPAKHAVPEKAAQASNTSGYDPANTFVIIAPEEPPIANTRAGFPLYSHLQNRLRSLSPKKL